MFHRPQRAFKNPMRGLRLTALSSFTLAVRHSCHTLGGAFAPVEAFKTESWSFRDCYIINVHYIKSTWKDLKSFPTILIFILSTRSSISWIYKLDENSLWILILYSQPIVFHYCFGFSLENGHFLFHSFLCGMSIYFFYFILTKKRKSL